MLPAFPVYIFDVDGTLMDSQADICGAIRTVLAARGCLDVTDERLRPYIGRHLLDEFLDFGFAPADIEGMISEYRGIYAGRKHAATTVFSGIHHTLARLGGRKATGTTKGTATTRMVLEQFGLLTHFDHVQGTDGFPAKPEPDVLLKAVAALDARPADCLFVGDSAADMEAGRRAGIRTCAVTWGYGDAEEMARWEPDFWIDRPHQLVADH